MGWKIVDQDGMSISSESAQRSLLEPTAEEPNTAVSLSKEIALSLLDTTDHLLALVVVSLENAPGAFLLTRSVDPSLRTKIASASMQSKTQLLTLMGEILGMPLCMSQDGNAICVGNSLWPPELDE